ncbi:MAG: hypothetical protein R2735_02980 [Microthrixaceae bacterium]
MSESELGWRLEWRSGSVGELHTLEEGPFSRTARVCEAEGEAVVLSSAMSAELLAGQAGSASGVIRSGVEVARRRSGGGIVHLVPDAHVWIDVLLPRGDLLWTDDVSQSGEWLAEVWIRALGDMGVVGATMADAHWSDPELGRIVCFAATGPGEIVVGERKLVGISQRRNRHGARFQCVVYLNQEPEAVLGFLDVGAIGEDLMGRLAQALTERVLTLEGAGVTGGISETDVTGEDVVDAFFSRLPGAVPG